jgi:hypothetical protein
MRRSSVGVILIIGGLCLLLASQLLDRGPALASAAAPAQPPRPTLTPQSPPPTATPERPDQTEPTTTSGGRITGTVIDLTTGAPAPGIAVVVGDVTVISDANGNYDRSGLAAGSYVVALKLNPGQGTAAQDAITVELGDGATVVQHLSFRSAPPAPAPTSVSSAPGQLPTTGGQGDDRWLALLLGVGLLWLGVLVRGRGVARG